MPDLLVAGEALVDFVPDSQDPLAEVESFTRRAGGAPANVAAALATLDRPAILWTRVGEDPFGDHVVTTLRERGVPLDLVPTRLKKATTGSRPSGNAACPSTWSSVIRTPGRASRFPPARTATGRSRSTATGRPTRASSPGR